ncbi:non-ribosomal peptide synthetase [Ancylobacter sp. 6x-1]|uniref:Non-ribosomal peptide synthetase n=1 Tax=Ancylobacter crimeensis TaxID=2579147 RepID=A0ABT0DBD4_9HYPH|nr:non-ribosomal peptide synthetase [Ancylobacter crimeensis]MCK0197264.1 non-ribosomal peptide synthetase [Ancylobacter crimeensis]
MTVHGLFARQVHSAPNATSIREGGLRLTYADLDFRSNQLARYLLERDVGAGDRVALLTGRSADAILAILAILKVGAVFVPLDPAYPAERLAHMLGDAAPVLVVGHAELSPGIAQAAGERFVDLAGARDASAALSAEVLPECVSGEDPAYVMYTSGSTGRPKGVVVPHRAIARLVSGQTYARFAPDEVILHLAPLAFDASTFEIWGALLNGGSLGVVPAAKPALDDIVAAIAAYGVSTAWFTAGLFHLLVDQRLEGLRPLRRILTGGDVVSPAHIARARAALPHCTFVNGYGPTENTTFSCCHIIDRIEGGALPIGRPIAHSTAYVLDQDFHPVPAGEAGQLCVGGAGLALGYLNAPELTAEKFRVVPSVGERLYLTGDLARCRPGGTFEFLGRLDQQVKIDGNRVEIEEIESALRREPEVADAAIVACGSPAAGRRLVAFVKPAMPAARETLASALTERLRRSLPAYMVPSGFRLIDELPLTANGKTDRKALVGLAETPEVETPDVSAAAAQAMSGIEARLARLWGEVLGLTHVPRDVNFFELGGTSLRLMNIHARLGEIAGTPLRLVELFDHPTVASLAARLDPGAGAGERLAGDRGGDFGGVLGGDLATRADSRQAALRRMRDNRLGRTP